jgi:HK97 family phage major capsid protein
MLEELLNKTREKRAVSLAEAETIVTKAGAEARSVTEEENKAYLAAMAAADAAHVEEQRLAKLIADKASLAVPEGRKTSPAAPAVLVPVEKTVAAPRLLRSARVRNFRADGGVSAEERAHATGQWLLATIGANTRAAQWCHDHGIEVRGTSPLTTTTNSLGGYLVPEVLESTIIDLREERGVARRSVRVMPMASDSVVIPRRASGVTAYFVAENAEITASDKNWDAVSLTARKLAVMCKMSSEIAEDAIISIADDLASEIAYAFADKEDECLFNGDGTSTYGGVVGLKSAVAAGGKVTAATGNTAFSTLDLEDFEQMVGKLPQYAVANAAWYVSRVGWANSMLRLAEAAGGNTVAQVAGGAPFQFLGFPVVIAQVMNSTTTAQVSTDGLAYLGDLRLAATMGTRRGISIDVDPSRYFEFDQIAIRGTQRFDLNVHERGTASVAGPVIMLSTPGS